MLVPVIDYNETSSTYGRIVDFEVRDGGSGYNNTNIIKMTVVSRKHLIRTGTEAEIVTINEGNTIYMVRRGFDGTPFLAKVM